MRLTLFVALLSFALDQISKWAVVHGLNLKQIGAIEVFPPFLNFYMGWNRGVNFGLLADHAEILRWVWVALALGISFWILLWVKREPFSKMGCICAGLLIGGALGNAIDRVVYGAVADFLNMSCCGISNPYAFNVADITIFAGAIGLIFFTPQNEKQA